MTHMISYETYNTYESNFFFFTNLLIFLFMNKKIINDYKCTPNKHVK